jgi:hypothetical protein
MKLLQSIRGYRTIIVNVIAIAVSLLIAVGLLPAAEFAGVNQETVGDGFDKIAANVDALVASVLSVLAVVNGALRFLTKGAVGQKIL